MLVGEPCTGKSTLMRAFMAEGDFMFVRSKGFARHADGWQRVVVFGDYDTPSQFPGTDRLAMGVKPIAMEYAHDYGHKGWHVMWEGQRLGNVKTARDLQAMGFDVRIGVTVTDPEELAVRRALERSQTDAFLRRSCTAVHNLVAAVPELVTLLRCDRESDTPRNLAWLRGQAEA